MSSNSVLFWMSARAHGTWQQYATAVEELHLPEEGEENEADDEDSAVGGLTLQNLLRLNLQRLGHAEFRAGARPFDWRIAPPVLAVQDIGDTARGILAGARSRRLLDRLALVSQRASLTFTPQNAAPDAIVLEGELDALLDVACAVPLTVQRDAPRLILMGLPIVNDRQLWRRGEAPVGADWRIDRFSAAELRWRTSDRNDYDTCPLGLFRFTYSFRRHVLLRAKGGVFEVPGQIGKYLVMRGQQRRTVAYDSNAQVFSAPAICRPPFLVERALISATGLLPQHEPKGPGGGTLHYHGVTQELALLASAVLRQELR